MAPVPGPEPQLPPEAFSKRRARIADALQDDQILVVATHEETVYANDVHHRFRPHSDFWYLTGFAEPGAVMTLDASGRYDLWMRPRDPKAEVWNGRRLGLERAEGLGVDRAHDIEDLDALGTMLRSGTPLAIAEHAPAIQQRVDAVEGAESGRGLVARFRMIKDADEQRMLAEAARIGNEAMREALPLAAAGRGEYEIEAALLAAYRRAGSTGPGYPPIVGTGANAAILHYIENQDIIAAGDLVLVDAGCEWGYYNSDITRTVPADGAFTKAQEDVFEAVVAAQEKALRAVRPGARFKDPHDAAVEVLVDRLVDMGHLHGDKDALIAENAHRPYFMHGTSHFLGLDVHDAGIYKDEEGESIRLEEGMCLTVEPGLYYNPDFARVPDSHVHIGVRLENDVIVTSDGARDLQRELPSRIEGLLA